MYLGYEEPVAMPTMGVYDTDLMKAYIAGVKEQYDQARLDMKDFNKLYGDFYSPIAGDTLNYYNMTVGGANKLIDDMMALGIDPYKNPQARAAIARYVANVPTGKLNEMKQSAENAKAYLLQKAKLQAAGKWNKAYEDYLLGGRSLDNWDTMTDGMWTRTSPSEYLDIFDSTNPWFANMKDSYLYSKDGYDYTGVTVDQMRPILDQTLSDYLKSDLGGFHYNTFRNAYLSNNPNASEDEIKQGFSNEILAKNERVVRTQREANPYDLDRAKTANDIYAERQKAAIRERSYANKLAAKALFDKNKTNTGQSYADDMYIQGIANIFKIDTDTATQKINDGSIGKDIYAVQTQRIKASKNSDGSHNYAKMLRMSSISGNTESNVEMVDRPTGGSNPYAKGKSLDKHTYVYDKKRDESSIKDGISIATTMAGYGSKKQEDRKVKLILDSKGATVTVTDRLLTYLGKDGRVHQAVKVIVKDAKGEKSAVAYQEIQKSMSNGAGQAVSSAGTHNQPMMIDVTSDYQGRKTRNAKATQVYTTKSKKDSGVYDYELDPDIDEDEDDD